MMMRRVVGGLIVASALFSVFGLDDSLAAGPVAPKPPGTTPKPKPTAAAIPTATATPAAPPAPVYYQPSVEGKNTTPYADRKQVTLLCGAGYALSTPKDMKGVFNAYCSKATSGVDSRPAFCPTGGMYVITDDKFLPAIKQRFGTADKCFKNDVPRPREDQTFYSPATCAVNGNDYGFKMVINAGPDKCEKTINYRAYHRPGAVGTAVNSPNEAQTQSLRVQCPAGSTLTLDIGGALSAATGADAPNGAGVLCVKN